MVKTRALAAALINAGHVRVNGIRAATPARPVRPGDVLTLALERQVRVLRVLEQRGCDYVPRLLESDPATLKIVTSNCGSIVTHISTTRVKELFAELERDYGVCHEDAFARNITYRGTDGRFCLIDFELATILDEPQKAAA